MRRGPTLLCRKVNTRTHGVRHGALGGDFRHQRNSKSEQAVEHAGIARGKMAGTHRHGRDYTPLFRFLVARVGQRWDDVFSAAAARLDTEAPIWWVVDLHPAPDASGAVRVGNARYVSRLTVDADGVLQKHDPALTEHDLEPGCGCCTHTFNGKAFTRTYRSQSGR